MLLTNAVEEWASTTCCCVGELAFGIFETLLPYMSRLWMHGHLLFQSHTESAWIILRCKAVPSSLQLSQARSIIESISCFRTSSAQIQIIYYATLEPVDVIEFSIGLIPLGEFTLFVMFNSFAPNVFCVHLWYFAPYIFHYVFVGHHCQEFTYEMCFSDVILWSAEWWAPPFLKEKRTFELFPVLNSLDMQG